MSSSTEGIDMTLTVLTGPLNCNSNQDFTHAVCHSIIVYVYIALIV